MKTDQCSSCNHSVVCPYQEDLAEAQKAIDTALKMNPNYSIFIKPITVECKHYSSKMSTRGIAS